MTFAPDAIVVLESLSVPGGVRYAERARFPFDLPARCGGEQ